MGEPTLAVMITMVFLKIHLAALAVGEPAVVEQPEQHVVHVSVGLFGWRYSPPLRLRAQQDASIGGAPTLASGARRADHG